MDGTFSTERLTLRPFAAMDLRELRPIVENPLVAEMAGFKVANNSFESSYFLQQLRHSNIWAVTLTESAALIGSVGLYAVADKNQEPDPFKLELGYMLNQGYWGNGYMKEAVGGVLQETFAQNQTYGILASTYATNVRSIAILTHLGFEKTGTRQIPLSVLNSKPNQENFYHLTFKQFKKGGYYATHKGI
ncbi:GNAT family N-acetyltransferase [Pediococcus siamensis]|uniref:GNAT family N-acetyltransferase n=1 Tax=Pediococcus siamensis TaxID=381829 RepID=UPI0039A14715